MSKRPTSPKATYNLNQKLKQAIRKVWAFSPMRRACLKAAYNTETDDWTCVLCNRRTERASVDHVIAVGLSNNWDEYIEMMFYGQMQAVCKQCHREKTKKDLKEMKRDTKSKTSKTSTRTKK